MAVVCSRWYLALCLSVQGALTSFEVTAQPRDGHRPGLAIRLQYESVGDSVDYSPNLPNGRFAAERTKPRFQSAGFMLSHNSRRGTGYYLSLKHRELNSLRDAFAVDEFGAGVMRRLYQPASRRFSLNLSLDARVNHASSIHKNSYTSYADILITQLDFVQPEDARVALTVDFAIALTEHWHMVAALSGGLSQTELQSVDGKALLDNGCEYEFNATVKGGSIRQIDTCNNIIKYEQHYPSNKALNDNLGFSVSDDLLYRDYFFAPRLSLHWQRGAWTVGSGYEFRQYYRPSLDERIRRAGGNPTTSNQNAFVEANVQFLERWQVGTRIRYQRAAFLDDIPFLYNTFTYQRYTGKGVLRYDFTLTRYFD